LFRGAMAALVAANIAFNQIGAEGGATLVGALKTSKIQFLGIGKQYKTAGGALITRSLMRTGVNLSLAGRSGEIVEIYSSNPEFIKMKWQDDGSTSEWTDIKTMDGEPLNLPLQSKFEGDSLDLSQQQIDPGYAIILSWWLTTPFTAALIKVDVSGNSEIGGEGKTALQTAIQGRQPTIELVV
jgi:hypothetical protein